LVYELPEDGTDVPKHVVAVKDHTFKCVRTCTLSWFYKGILDVYRWVLHVCLVRELKLIPPWESEHAVA